MRKFLLLLLGLLPAGGTKNRLLSLLPGVQVAPTAVVSPVLLLNVQRLDVHADAHIGLGSTLRDMRSVVLHRGARMGSWNWISAAPMFAETDLQSWGSLDLGRDSIVTSRHYLDCSGGIELGEQSAIGGVRTTILTHEADLEEWVQRAKPVRFGRSVLIATNVVIRSGVTIADGVVVGLGSTVLHDLPKPDHLYAGFPAKDRGPAANAGFVDRVEPWAGVFPPRRLSPRQQAQRQAEASRRPKEAVPPARDVG